MPGFCWVTPQSGTNFVSTPRRCGGEHPDRLSRVGAGHLEPGTNHPHRADPTGNRALTPCGPDRCAHTRPGGFGPRSASRHSAAVVCGKRRGSAGAQPCRQYSARTVLSGSVSSQRPEVITLWSLPSPNIARSLPRNPGGLPRQLAEELLSRANRAGPSVDESDRGRTWDTDHGQCACFRGGVHSKSECATEGFAQA